MVKLWWVKGIRQFPENQKQENICSTIASELELMVTSLENLTS